MDCIFCKIVRKEIPSKVVSDREEWMSFRDIHPQAPTHILVVPKRHVASLDDLGPQDGALMGKLFLEARRLAQGEGIARKGYRIVLNQGSEGGQTVSHLHLHLLGGRPMAWPPG